MTTNFEGPSGAPSNPEPEPALAEYPPPTPGFSGPTTGFPGPTTGFPGPTTGSPGSTPGYPSSTPGFPPSTHDGFAPATFAEVPAAGPGWPPPAYAEGLTPAPLFSPLPAAVAVPNWSVPKPGAMPDEPRDYHQLLRGPRRAWWRPVVSLLLAGTIALVLMLLSFVPVLAAAAVAGVADPLRWTAREIVNIDDLGPAGFLYVNLSLIVLIPTAMLAIWIAHRVRPRYLSSVQGGIRWRWLLRCVVLVVPLWVVYLGLSALLGPAAGPRPDHWGLLLLMVVLLTPLQAAGEEYLFRGWLMQNIGSWFRSPLVGLMVSLAVSVSLFSWAHGSPDIWVLGSLGVFALTAGLVTWRTGGLEAAIVIHAVNNVGVFFMVILLGQWKSAFVGADTTGVPSDVGIALVVHAVALLLIVWQAKKVGVQRRYLPQPQLPVRPDPPLSPPYPQQALPAPSSWSQG